MEHHTQLNDNASQINLAKAVTKSKQAMSGLSTSEFTSQIDRLTLAANAQQLPVEVISKPKLSLNGKIKSFKPETTTKQEILANKDTVGNSKVGEAFHGDYLQAIDYANEPSRKRAIAKPRGSSVSDDDEVNGGGIKNFGEPAVDDDGDTDMVLGNANDSAAVAKKKKATRATKTIKLVTAKEDSEHKTTDSKEPIPVVEGSSIKKRALRSAKKKVESEVAIQAAGKRTRTTAHEDVKTDPEDALEPAKKTQKVRDKGVVLFQKNGKDILAGTLTAFERTGAVAVSFTPPTALPLEWSVGLYSIKPVGPVRLGYTYCEVVKNARKANKVVKMSFVPPRAAKIPGVVWFCSKCPKNLCRSEFFVGKDNVDTLFDNRNLCMKCWFNKLFTTNSTHRDDIVFDD